MEWTAFFVLFGDCYAGPALAAHLQPTVIEVDAGAVSGGCAVTVVGFLPLKQQPQPHHDTEAADATAAAATAAAAAAAASSAGGSGGGGASASDIGGGDRSNDGGSTELADQLHLLAGALQPNTRVRLLRRLSCFDDAVCACMARWFYTAPRLVARSKFEQNTM